MRKPQPLSDRNGRISSQLSLANQWLQEFRNGQKHSMVILGPNGTGKTHLAKWLLWECGYWEDEDGNPIAPIGDFIPAVELMDALDSKLAIQDILTHGRLTVIDDVSKELSHQFIGAKDQDKQAHNLYNSIVEFAIQDPVTPIIFTASNAAETKKLFATHVGPSALDRILEMTGKYIVDFTGIPSWRKEQAGYLGWDKNGGSGR